MSTVKSVSELLTVPSGEIVTACKGRVAQIFRHYSGPTQGNKQGQTFRLQHLMLEDLDDPTAVIKVAIHERDPLPPDVKGKILAILANGKREGLTIEDETIRGDVYPFLRVTAAAEISPVTHAAAEPAKEEVPVGSPRPARAQPTQPVQPTQTPPAAAAPPAPDQPEPPSKSTTPLNPVVNPAEIGADRSAEVNLLAGRMAHIWLIAYAAARDARTVKLRNTKEDMTESMFENIVASIAIQLFTEQAHHKMPPFTL